MGGTVNIADTTTDWLTVGEGLIGAVLGFILGAVWILARVVGRHDCERAGPVEMTQDRGPARPVDPTE